MFWAVGLCTVIIIIIWLIFGVSEITMMILISIMTVFTLSLTPSKNENSMFGKSDIILMQISTAFVLLAVIDDILNRHAVTSLLLLLVITGWVFILMICFLLQEYVENRIVIAKEKEGIERKESV